MPPLRILFRQDLRELKGIRTSRSRLHEQIKDGTFPPPDGKTTDAPTAPNWWFESTIDRYLRERAKKMQAVRQVAGKNTVAAAN
jgi:predicted DNA-binding transcriptional regulator AlpA